MTRPRMAAVLLALAALSVGCARITPVALPVVSLSPSPSPSASGSPEPTGVVAPNIRHKDLELARINVAAEGLELKVTEKKETLNWAPNTILKQSPKGGTEMEPGDTIEVTVSVAPECHPSYPDICIKPFQRRVHCRNLDVYNIRVLEPDPYNLDEDDDGIGCEGRRARDR